MNFPKRLLLLLATVLAFPKAYMHVHVHVKYRNKDPLITMSITISMHSPYKPPVSL